MRRGAFQPMKQVKLDRRDFLRLSGILGIGLAACPISAPLAEAVRFDNQLYKVSKSTIGMGTFISITVLDPSKDHAEEAIAQAFQEIERLSKLLSRYDNETPLSQLNQSQTLKDAPAELLFVIRKSLHYHQVSNGFFDITVKPVLDAFTRSPADQGDVSLPKETIIRLLEVVDSRLISLDGSGIAFRKDGMGITLDGIAKGFIVDKAIQKLREHNIHHALLNAGGDIRTIGDKGNNRPWKIAIEDPLKKRDYPDTVAITNGSIATSGNYEVFFDREKVLHHIVNPKTGLSPLIYTSVSVTAPTAMEADALSTTVFLLDPTRGMRLINSLPLCESLIITRNQNKIKSNGWRGIRIS
jgi:thiamine biosynthesis lipoprotein